MAIDPNQYCDVLHRVVARMMRFSGVAANFAYDELYNEGYIALTLAAKSYDVAKSPEGQPEPWLGIKIKWWLLTYIRNQRKKETLELLPSAEPYISDDAVLDWLDAKQRYIETTKMSFLERRNRHKHLTRSMIRVLAYAALGYTERETAKALSVSVNTIKTHRKNLLYRMKLENVTHAVYVATVSGLLPHNLADGLDDDRLFAVQLEPRSESEPIHKVA